MLLLVNASLPSKLLRGSSLWRCAAGVPPSQAHAQNGSHLGFNDTSQSRITACSTFQLARYK